MLMKKWIPALAVMALVACNSENKPSDQPVVAAATNSGKPADAAAAAPDSATQAKNWMAYSEPGAEQKALAEASGRWDAEITMCMAPGTPEQKTTTVVDNKMVLGGRYQMSSHKGNMMGMAFEGISTVGYDNHKKQYQSTWIDNMGTGIMVMNGTWDEATKTINFSGKMMNPGTKAEEDVRETFTIIDKDHQLMQMYAKGPDGKEFKTMQIHYTRKR
ncbi:MAG: DUF1579 domain-containing protein [Chitinophagaceae bacterium]|nr:MAG: DUF1579 domain-containing protein [Chitinophagaceae bacterium]